MSLSRAVLVFSAAFVLLAGVACVIAPASLAQQAGLSATPGGLTEIRAYYGGLEIGLGCFLLWCIRQPTLILAGLVMVALTVGGTGMARVLGMLVDQAPTAYHLANLATEATTVGVVGVAISRHRRLAGAAQP